MIEYMCSMQIEQKKDKTKLRGFLDSKGVDFAIILLVVLSVVLLVLEWSFDLDKSWLYTLYFVDFIVAFIFLIEFSLSTYASDNKVKYMKDNWMDLVASIPIPTYGELRILRFLKILRLIARLRKLTKSIDDIKEEEYHIPYLKIALVFITAVLLFSSIFYEYERGINPAVGSYFDAIWWTVVTSSTVGYGDVAPITIPGKIVAMVLMLFGIGLFASISGMVVASLTTKYTQRFNKRRQLRGADSDPTHI